MNQKTIEMLDKHGLYIFFEDGHGITIWQDNNRLCFVEMSDCNDQKQLQAIVSAFVQGCNTDL